MNRSLLIKRKLPIILSAFILLLLNVSRSNGQVNLYDVTIGSGVATEDMNGFSLLIGSGQDNSVSTLQNIGFNFTYNNVVYSQYSVNSNGLMRLGSTLISNNAINQLTVNSDFPKIAPYWDDVNTAAAGYCGAKLVGVAPNRKLSIEWLIAVPKNSANTGRVQVWLFETTNVIQFVYNTGMNVNNNGYSVGLAAATTDFISVSPGGASPSFSKITETNTNITAITSGTSVIFTPPVLPPACTATSTPTGSGNSNAVQLNWTPGAGNPTSYDVYFGTSANPPLVSPSHLTTTYNPGVLNYNTTYFYKIVPKNSAGSASGCSVNQFTTATAINYNVNRTTGISYSSIIGTGTSASGWRNGTNTDDNLSNSQPIGFNFPYQGTTYSNFSLSTNGFITFNVGTSNTGGGNGDYSYTNSLNDTGGTLIVAPFYEDLICQGNSGSQTSLNNSMKYAVSGVAGSRILTVEWTGMEIFNHAGPNLNFQVKLYEATGDIDFVYGTMEGFNGTTNYFYSYSVGLNGVNLSIPVLNAEYIHQINANTRNFGNSATSQLVEVPTCNTSLKFTPGAYIPFVLATLPPVNDQKTSPQHLDVNTSACIELCGTYYSSANATPTPGMPACSSGNADDDVWFEFTATNPNTTIKVLSGGNYDAAVELYNSSNTILLCTNVTGLGLTETLAPTTLVAGQQYFLRIYHNQSGSGSGSGQFSVCVSATPIPPVNDNCAAAISLPVVTGVFTTGSQTVAATTSPSVPACSVAGTFADDDVWYSFIATNTTEIITVVGGTGFNAVVQLFSGACGGLTSIQCVNNLGNGQTEVLTANNLVKTQLYFIRVYHAGVGGGTGLFSINVSTTVPACPGNTIPVSPTSDINHVGTTLKWSPVANANSYTVYLDVVNPPIQVLINTTDTSAATGLLNQGESYYWQVRANNTAGSSQSCFISTFATEPFDYALRVKVFVEAMYTSNQTMQAVFNPNDTISDSITVSLASPATKQILWSTKTLLNTTGTANALFPQPALGASYYIVVKHRNSLETWSQGTFAFNAPDTIYDFSNAANKAFGNNQVQVEPGVFAIHSGDINQDGIINATDFVTVDNTLGIGIFTGYISTDVNGDGILESSDYSFMENKTQTIRTVLHP